MRSWGKDKESAGENKTSVTEGETFAWFWPGQEHPSGSSWLPVGPSHETEPNADLLLLASRILRPLTWCACPTPVTLSLDF